MKTVIYALILSLAVVSGLVFANRVVQNETPKKSIPKPLTDAEKKAVLKKWEATPDGIQFKKWEESPPVKRFMPVKPKSGSPLVTIPIWRAS